MSETVTHIGKMVQLDLGNTSMDDFAKICLSAKKYTKDDFYDTHLECLLSEFGDKYIQVGENIYEITENKKLGDGHDINFLTKNEDGTISFVSQFYNGGTCLSEMLEHGIKALEPNNTLF